MTKNDFILHAMLQMASNKKYVNIEKGDDGIPFPSLDAECIYIDAEALAHEAEKRMDCPFDEPQDVPTFSNKESLMTIANNIDEHLDKLDVIADALEQYIRMKQ